MVDILKMIKKEQTYLESLFTTFEWTLELFWHAEEKKKPCKSCNNGEFV